MKYKLFSLFFLMYAYSCFAQVIISPYIVLTGQQNKFGSFIVQNESKEPYEIMISFVFGYPVSDSVGVMSMKYIDKPDSITPSVINWIKAFPKKFILEPGQKQVIRMTVQPDRKLSPGTFWGRIVTSSSPVSVQADTVQKGITAKIRFVMNQITTLLYRVSPIITSADLKSSSVSKDSTGSVILADIIRNGNTPFYGDLIVSLSDSLGNKIDEQTESISLYYELIKKIQLGKLKPGNYQAEIKIIHNEKDIIPESDLTVSPPFIKRIGFTVN
jgi:P pilus assembly chaperone PapD